jgi:hypothetical protein
MDSDGYRLNENLDYIIKDATKAGYKVGWLSGVLNAVHNLKMQKLLINEEAADEIALLLLDKLPPDLLEKN